MKKKNRSVLLVPADKAGNNIVSVCNINCILDELGFHSASGNQKSFFFYQNGSCKLHYLVIGHLQNFFVTNHSVCVQTYKKGTFVFD